MRFADTKIKKKFRRWLVIGGSGFIGGHLVDQLIQNGDSVVVVDNFSLGHYRNPAARYVRVDVRDGKKLSRVVKSIRPDVVVGAWAVRLLQCLEDPMLGIDVNCRGAVNVLEAIRRIDGQLIYLSTGSVYGHGLSGLNKEDGPTIPNTTYGASKLAAEAYVNAYASTYGIDSVILRLHCVFGPRQDYSRYGGVVAIFVNRLLSHKPPVIYGNGRQTRPFLYVQDAVRAIVLSCVTKNARGCTINIAGKKHYSINHLAQLALKHTTSRHDPIHVAVGNRPHVMHFRPSLVNARTILRFSPLVDLPEGLQTTIEQMRSDKDAREN